MRLRAVKVSHSDLAAADKAELVLLWSVVLLLGWCIDDRSCCEWGDNVVAFDYRLFVWRWSEGADR
jgi:hypothetical protein